MSYEDDTKYYCCDGPGCANRTFSFDGWIRITRERQTTDSMATAKHYCSIRCERRARGFAHCLTLYVSQVEKGTKTLQQAILEATSDLVLDPHDDPDGSDAIGWARLMSQAWHVLAGHLQRTMGGKPEFGIDEAIVGINDDPMLDLFLNQVAEKMMQLGSSAAQGNITIEQAARMAAEDLMPKLRRMSIRHGGRLGAIVRELTFPFRVSADFQTRLADELDQAVVNILKEKA